MRKITYAQASLEALQEEFRRDNKTVHMSTDIPVELQEEFGEERVRCTPISESAFVGAAPDSDLWPTSEWPPSALWLWTRW